MARIAPAAPAIVLLPGTMLGCNWHNCGLPSATATLLPPLISFPPASASNLSGATLRLSFVPLPTTLGRLIFEKLLRGPDLLALQREVDRLVEHLQIIIDAHEFVYFRMLAHSFGGREPH